jgi:hypothetical protein
MFSRLPGAGRAALFLVLLLAGSSGAQVVETRGGDANPMVSVFKSTIYGAGAGFLLGLAIEVADDDGGGDAVRWGFVTGTFFGFAYGLYHVSTRPGPTAMLDRGPGPWALRVPDIRLSRRGPDERVLAFAPAAAGRRTPGLQVPLVALRF